MKATVFTLMQEQLISPLLAVLLHYLMFNMGHVYCCTKALLATSPTYVLQQAPIHLVTSLAIAASI